jgi:hypothetical protein
LRKGKKKKAPSRSLRDVQRAPQCRAEAEKLVARLESERAERAGEEHERTDWRAVAQDDLVDSDGEVCFEDPRQTKWTGLLQDPREAPENKAVLALRSLVRAAAEPTARATARVLAMELAVAKLLSSCHCWFGLGGAGAYGCPGRLTLGSDSCLADVTVGFDLAARVHIGARPFD